MKKLLALLFSVVLSFSFVTPAFALESETLVSSVTINEYDVYVSTRCASSSELLDSGVSPQQVDLIRSNAIENELLRLSELTVTELAALGYNTYQAEILQGYTGERIETNQNLRSVFATMTMNFYKLSANNTMLRIKAEWEWGSAPVLSGGAIHDMVAMRWQGTNSAGSPINLALDSAGSICSVKYYTLDGVYKRSAGVSVICNSPYDHAYAEIPMHLDDNSSNYAKEGYLVTRVERTGSDVINEAAFVFAYGHTVIGITPSLALPPSFGIGFSVGTETMVEEAIRVDSRGNITRY